MLWPWPVSCCDPRNVSCLLSILFVTCTAVHGPCGPVPPGLPRLEPRHPELRHQTRRSETSPPLRHQSGCWDPPWLLYACLPMFYPLQALQLSFICICYHVLANTSENLVICLVYYPSHLTRSLQTVNNKSSEYHQSQQNSIVMTPKSIIYPWDINKINKIAL